MKLFILSLLLLSLNLYAAQWPSATRSENADYKSMMNKSIKGYYSSNTAVKVSKDYSKFDNPQLPEWQSAHEAMEAFTTVRDLRFLNWEYKGEDFPRRATWLYPDDGCYLRAELAVDILEARGYTNLYKVFAFGNLKVDTDNHPNGYVSWWYHVVPIIALDGDYVVFDPAINPEGPLTLEQWLETMSYNINNIEVAICETHAVGPYDDCYNPEQEDMEDIASEQYRFLSKEWSRIYSLYRDPYQELGDNPPWSK